MFDIDLTEGMRLEIEHASVKGKPIRFFLDLYMDWERTGNGE